MPSSKNSVASVKANDEFYEAYKKETVKHESDDEHYNEGENQFSDDSEQERNLAGVTKKDPTQPVSVPQSGLSSPRKP